MALSTLERLLGLSWALLRRSWSLLGGSWESLGALLGRSWDAVGRSWDALGTLLGRSGRFLTFLDDLDSILDPPGADFGRHGFRF